MTETKQRLARGESPKAACTWTGHRWEFASGNGKRETGAAFLCIFTVGNENVPDAGVFPFPGDRPPFRDKR